MLQFGWMQAFVEVTLTVVYHSGQSQSGQSHQWAWQSIIDMSPRPQGGVNGLCWNTLIPIGILTYCGPCCTKFCNQFCSCTPLLRPSSSWTQFLVCLFDSYGNFWIIDEGRGSLSSWAWALQQRKLDFLFRRHWDNKEVKLQLIVLFFSSKICWRV